MIRNAADSTLEENPGTLPDMSGAIANWFQKMKFRRVTKKVVNFVAVETFTEVVAMAVKQPLTAQKLQMKPEGQRQWKWEMLHASPDTVLFLDDEIMINGVRFRVMEKLDFKEYGFVEYHLCQDYQS